MWLPPLHARRTGLGHRPDNAVPGTLNRDELLWLLRAGIRPLCLAQPTPLRVFHAVDEQERKPPQGICCKIGMKYGTRDRDDGSDTFVAVARMQADCERALRTK